MQGADVNVASESEIKCFTLMLRAGAENRFEMTALMFAAMYGHHQCVERLVEAGADVNLRSSTGETALFDAATSGNLRSLEVLTSAGTYLNQINAFGKSAIAAAAGKGHTEVIGALIKAGADVNAHGKDRFYDSPHPLDVCDEECFS